jgi:hypothetical protein
MSTRRLFALGIALPVLVIAALQLVPYGRDHAVPPDGQLARFDSPQTEALVKKACFDCHSNRTRWPWYSSLAPVSWRIQSHVNEGREALNFTALATASKDGAEAAGEAGETVGKGEMPPRDYLLLHPEARLSAADRQALVRGLDATFAAFVEGGQRDACCDSLDKAAAHAVGAAHRAEASERGEAGERDETLERR